jgi:hypothetical protein
MNALAGIALGLSMYCNSEIPANTQRNERTTHVRSCIETITTCMGSPQTREKLDQCIATRRASR